MLSRNSAGIRKQCGNKGVERTQNKSQHAKLTLEKNILPLLLPGFELATFRSQVRRSNQQAIPAPSKTTQITTAKQQQQNNNSKTTTAKLLSSKTLVENFQPTS